MIPDPRAARTVDGYHPSSMEDQEPKIKSGKFLASALPTERERRSSEETLFHVVTRLAGVVAVIVIPERGSKHTFLITRCLRTLRARRALVRVILLPGCAAFLYVSLRSKKPGDPLISLHNPVARAARALALADVVRASEIKTREGLYWGPQAMLVKPVSTGKTRVRAAGSRHSDRARVALTRALRARSVRMHLVR